METTPNDLRQQQFEIKFRGYNPDDVEVFRELAANALEEARADVLQLDEENKHIKERLKYLVELEETLKAAVLETQKNAESTVATAKKEAEFVVAAAEKEKELILREAQQQRNEVIADMHHRMGKLVNDINKIRFIRTNYLSKLKNLVSSQLEMIDMAMQENAEEEQQSPDLPKRASYDPQESEVPEHMDERVSEDPQPDQQPQQTAEPAAETSSDKEWQHLKEQLNED
jgi:cell division initiation protein